MGAGHGEVLAVGAGGGAANPQQLPTSLSTKGHPGQSNPCVLSAVTPRPPTQPTLILELKQLPCSLNKHLNPHRL